MDTCVHILLCVRILVYHYICVRILLVIHVDTSLYVFATSMRTHVPLYMCSLRILLCVSSYYYTSSVHILLRVCLHACIHVSSSATVCVLLYVCEPVS
jgi:hypothetical protein